MILDEFRYAGSQLDDSDIPIDVSNIIRTLISVVSKQQQEINNINSRFETVEDNSQKAIEQLVKQMKAHGEYTQQEITKQVIQANKNSLSERLVKRVTAAEESIRKLRSTLDETDKWSNTRIDMLERKQQDDNADVRSIILEMQQQPMEMPSTYRNEEDQPHVIDGTTDISPLIRGIYRDSRRLDGFDELISQTRNECKEIVDSVIGVQENLVQFNHNIHDLSLTDGKLSKRIGEVTSFFSESLDNNDKHIIEVYALIVKIATCLHASISISNDSFNTIENILCRLSSRTLPHLPSMSECQIEAYGLREEIQDKKTLYEDDRTRYNQSPDGFLPSHVFKDVSVKKMQRKQEKTNVKNFVFKDDPTKFNQSLNDSTTLMLIVEDLNNTVAQLKHELLQTEQQLTDMVKKQNNALKDLSDAKTTEVSLAKFETVLNKLSKRVQQLENKPKTVVVKDTTRRQTVQNDYIDPLLTTRTFSRESNFASRKLTATASAPLSSRSHKTPSRLVADKVASPF